jgi:hypothetical protein
MQAVPHQELQLVGVSEMLITCKYEEIWAPEAAKAFVSLCSFAAYASERTLNLKCWSFLCALQAEEETHTETLKHHTGFSELQLI